MLLHLLFLFYILWKFHFAETCGTQLSYSIPINTSLCYWKAKQAIWPHNYVISTCSQAFNFKSSNLSFWNWNLVISKWHEKCPYIGRYMFIQAFNRFSPIIIARIIEHGFLSKINITRNRPSCFIFFLPSGSSKTSVMTSWSSNT